MDPHSGDDLIVNLFAAVQSALGKESVQQCSSSALAAAVTTDPPYLYQAVTSTISKHIEKTSPATGAPDDDGAAMRIDVRGGGKAVPEAGRSLTSAFDLGLCEADQASLQAVLAKGQAAGERGGGQLEGDERATQRVVEVSVASAFGCFHSPVHLLPSCAPKELRFIRCSSSSIVPGTDYLYVASTDI